MKQILKSLHLPLAPVALLLITSTTGSAWYDPGVQRWITRDPVGEAWGLNLYQFVSGNPVSYHDNDGLRSTPAPAAPDRDTCEPQQRKDIDNALPAACNRLHKPCSDPDCMNVIADGARGCKAKPKIQCAKPGDAECNGHCAYADGNVITLCPGKAFPATGENCQGHGGPMSLEPVINFFGRHLPA